MTRPGVVFAILGVATLAGCGGGGGGGSPPSAAAPAPVQSVTFDSASDLVNFTNNTVQSSGSSLTGSQVTITADASGNATITLNIPTGGGTVFNRTFSLNSAVATDPAGPIPGYIIMNT